MMPDGSRRWSLQARLGWRLGIVLLGALLLIALILGRYVWLAVDNLDDVSLQVQAEQIKRNLIVDRQGVRLALSDELSRAYRESGDGFLYSVLRLDGRILVASSDKAHGFMELLPESQLQATESYFRLLDGNGRQTPYFALLTSVPMHPELRIVVAQSYIHMDAYIESLLTEFAEHVGWTLPFVIIAALAISIYTIRSSLSPLKYLSEQARLIGPSTSNKRLPTAAVPVEILPLLQAVNSALDRLEQGIQAQRRFTANAAHELRTPLAVLTARISELKNDETAQQLAEDVERMNRLVTQLLQVSRLDALVLRLDEIVELNQLAADVVAFLAPLAVAAKRSLALKRSTAPVFVQGSAMALEGALRNLVENALVHTPTETEVVVTIGDDGSIAVRDHGPGVPAGARRQVFERFWRGRRESGLIAGVSHGAGLGLAIVAEAVRAHGGNVEIRDAVDGGAEFIICLPLPTHTDNNVSVSGL